MKVTLQLFSPFDRQNSILTYVHNSRARLAPLRRGRFTASLAALVALPLLFSGTSLSQAGLPTLGESPSAHKTAVVQGHGFAGAAVGLAKLQPITVDGSGQADPAQDGTNGALFAAVEQPAEAELAAAQLVPSRLSLIRYTVVDGDTAWSIANRYGLTPEAVLWSNQLTDPGLLRIGQKLVLPPVEGLVHQVQGGDTVSKLAGYYEADLKSMVAANGLDTSYLIKIGQQLIVPGGRIPEPPAGDEAEGQSGPASDLAGQPAQLGLANAMMLPDSASLPRPTGANSAQANFILAAAPAARKSQVETGIPASVTVAQAILESEWGRSRLSRENYNYFGIKARGREGSAGVVEYETWEVVGGESIRVRAPFRAYHSMADSFIDHGRFFLENPRYRQALAARDDARAFAREIANAGYATDPAYSGKLIGLMDRFNLYVYDLA